MTQPTAPLQKARPKELAAALKARYPVLAVGMVIEIQGALFRVKSFGKRILMLEAMNGAEIRRGQLTEDAEALTKRALAGKGDPLWLRLKKRLGLVFGIGCALLAASADASGASQSTGIIRCNVAGIENTDPGCIAGPLKDTGDYTITADETVTWAISQPPEPMGSMVLSLMDDWCALDELFSASDALLEFFPAPDTVPRSTPAVYLNPPTEPERLRAEADRIERKEAAIHRWRVISEKCSRIYKVLRDGAK